MATVRIHAPNVAFKGTVAGVVFKDGVGEADRKKDAVAIAYFRRRGYGIGSKKPEGPAAPERPVDARAAASVTVGTPLRDAAVDPKPGDFLPPTNAGEADPHGPAVVAPQIHGTGPKGIRGGPVHVDEPAKQEAEETKLAKAVLLEGQTHVEAQSAGAPAASANKPAWVDYAVERGATRDEAEALTKAELVERYGG